MPGFESTGWFGFIAPAGTPPEVIATLDAALVKVLREGDVIERVRALGAEPVPMTPAEFSQFIRIEIDKWLEVAAAGRQKAN